MAPSPLVGAPRQPTYGYARREIQCRGARGRRARRARGAGGVGSAVRAARRHRHTAPAARRPLSNLKGTCDLRIEERPRTLDGELTI